MDVIDELIACNQGFAAPLPARHLDVCPSRKLTITDDGFRAELQEATGVAPAFAIESFTDVEANVAQSIVRVRRSAFLPHRDQVRGFVYNVDNHRLSEVTVAQDQ